MPEVDAWSPTCASARSGRGRRDRAGVVLRAEDLRPAAAGAAGPPVNGVARHGKFVDIDVDGAAPRLPPGPRRLAALVGRAARQPARPGKARSRCGCASTGDGARRVRPHRGGHPEAARRLPRARPARTCPASPRSGPTRSPTSFDVERSPRCSPGAARRSRGCCATRVHRRHRQRLLRRDPARRQDVAVRDGGRASTTSEVDRLYAAMRDDARATRRRGRAASRPKELKDEKRSRHAGARPHRRGLPGVRRHRPRGGLRRLVAAVLPDLPDRRQAAEGPHARASS